MIKKLLFVLCFSCFAVCGGGADSAADFREVLRQATALTYDSIEYEFVKERSMDGGNSWEKVEKGSILWDRRNSSFKVAIVEQNSENVRVLQEKVAMRGRCYTVFRTFAGKIDEALPKKPLHSGNISVFPMRRGMVPLAELDDHKGELNDLLSGKNITSDSFQKNELGVALRAKDVTFLFDTKTGRLLSRKEQHLDAKGQIDLGIETNFGDYENYGGISVPLRINYAYINRGKTIHMRYTLKRDSVRVNGLKDGVAKFSFPIAKDAVIMDGVNGIVYRSIGTDGMIPSEEISKELDDILEDGEGK